MSDCQKLSPLFDLGCDLLQYLPVMLVVQFIKCRPVEDRGWISAIISIINVQDMLGLADVRIDIQCRGRLLPRRAVHHSFHADSRQAIRIMKIFAAALLSLSFLVMAPSVAETDGDQAELLGTLTGGSWHSRDGQGSYRVILENVGFEHVSCHVWIEWLTTTTSGNKQPGQPPRLVARTSYKEISSGFWSCNSEKVGLAGATLTIHANHTYSGENRKFCAVLGAPGEYRDQGLC